jgi:phage tail protein X
MGWAAILGLVVLTALAMVGAGGILRPLITLGSFAVGVFLYRRYPILYMGFAWWLWLLAPFVARVIDYRSSFDPLRLVLLSQYLVTLLTLHTFLKHLPKASRQDGLPFVLAFVGVVYGFLVGLINTSPITAFRGLLDWLPPIPFGFYLFINWRDYPEYRQNIQRVFLWGVLVTGAYGVVQYLVVPEWDRFWLISTKLTSFGDPEPFKLRIWSTMPSPGPFAVMMMTGLLLLFTSKEALRLPAAGAGYLAFLLTMVRTLWGAWFLGLLILIVSLKAHLQMRLLVTILIMAVCVVPLVTIEPFATTINTRLQTFSNLEEDDSAKVRKEIYEKGLNSALTNGLGNGIGNTFIVKEGKLEPVVIDSGILDMFFTLGWFGAVFYLGGLLLLLYNLFQYSEFRFDPFMAAARAISIACFMTLPGGSTMLAFGGIVLWGFLGIAIAGHKYHQHQRTAKLD